MNCTYYAGDMVPVASYHDTAERKLLVGHHGRVAGTAAAPALEAVLDSLMAHPNMGPFIGKQLIQKLVEQQPVAGVCDARGDGLQQRQVRQLRHRHEGRSRGHRGGRVARCRSARRQRRQPQRRQTARTGADVHRRAARLERQDRRRRAEPGGGATACASTCSARLRCSTTSRPTIPVAGTALVGPEYGIHSANAALERLNFLTYALDWDGSAPSTSIPNAAGTKVDLSAFTADAADAAVLVDRLSLLALGQALPTAPRQKVIDAVSWWTAQTDATNWKLNRVKSRRLPRVRLAQLPGAALMKATTMNDAHPLERSPPLADRQRQHAGGRARRRHGWRTCSMCGLPTRPTTRRWSASFSTAATTA